MKEKTQKGLLFGPFKVEKVPKKKDGKSQETVKEKRKYFSFINKREKNGLLFGGFSILALFPNASTLSGISLSLTPFSMSKISPSDSHPIPIISKPNQRQGLIPLVPPRSLRQSTSSQSTFLFW